MKPKRKKIHREWLENQLAKYERRIQKLAENAYHIRQAIELMDRQEAARNQEKGEIGNVVQSELCETVSAEKPIETTPISEDVVSAAQESAQSLQQNL